MIRVSRLFFLLLFPFFFYFFLSSFLFLINFFIPPIFFIIALLILYAIFEGSKKNEAFVMALMFGFMIDVYSLSLPVGVTMLAFFVNIYLIKLILKKYVTVSSFS